MSDVTGVQMSEYLKLDQQSPYTALFQHIFDTLKPKPKNVESKNMEDGEIEEDNSKAELPPMSLASPGKVQADSRKREDSKPEEPSERSLGESTSREKTSTSRGNKRRNKKKKKDKRRKTMDSSERRSESEKEEEETRPKEFKGFDFKVLYDLDNNPMRRRWLKRYKEFMISKGKSLTQCPSICKVRPVLSNL